MNNQMISSTRSQPISNYFIILRLKNVTNNLLEGFLFPKKNIMSVIKLSPSSVQNHFLNKVTYFKIVLLKFIDAR